MVYQGERKLVKENKLLGSFELSGIPPAPLGVQEITVRFHIDKDGILTVTANEKSGGSGKIQVDRSKYHLSNDVINKMIKEAKKFEDEDNKSKRELPQEMTLKVMYTPPETASMIGRIWGVKFLTSKSKRLMHL